MTFRTRLLLSVGGSLLLAMAVACTNDQAEQGPTPQAGVQKEAAAADQQLTFPLTGKVAETFESGGYTYIRLDSASGEYWVATAKTEVKEGEEITVPSGQVMQNFHSRTLDRTFPEIIFATGLAGKETGQQAAAHPKAASSDSDSFAAALQKEGDQTSSPSENADVSGMLGSTKAVVPSADVQVEKAEGKNAYTVGELYEQAEKLDGQQVKIRGKVMKVSSNIMGRNWIHLQDGTGNTMQNTHDLVVTSSAVPEKGQVITAEGVLHANKDFGAGYKYAAIVEEAKIGQ